jgi:hypothetical protein
VDFNFTRTTNSKIMDTMIMVKTFVFTYHAHQSAKLGEHTDTYIREAGKKEKKKKDKGDER